MTKNQWKNQNRKNRIQNKVNEENAEAIGRGLRKHGLGFPINWPAQKAWGAKMVLLKSIHREIDPMLQAEREAWEKLGNGVTPFLENNPETYGRTSEQTLRKYYLGTVSASGRMGADANQEPDEIGAVVIGASVHSNDDNGREQVSLET